MKKHFESVFLKDVLKELFSNKINLVFMLLALVISLTALNTIYSLGESAKKQVLDVLANLQFGKDAMLVIAGGGKIVGVTTTRADTMKMKDVEDIEKLEFVRLVSPWARGILEVSYKGFSEKIRIEGVTPSYTIANNWYPKEGRFFNEEDLKTMAKVCVLGAEIPQKLNTKQLIGEKIKIGGEYFEIIGILEPKPSFGHFRHDERILIPLTTAMRRVFNKDHLDAMKILFKENTDVNLAQEAIRNLLRKNHNLYGIQPDDFRLITPDMAIERFTAATRILTVFLLAISVISLVISGVIIMNLMYANIEEKSSVIALRLALGATPSHIIKHYLTIALIIALISGVIGWILSLGLMKLISFFSPLKPLFSWNTFFISLCFSTLTTVIFSLIPAYKATQIEPSILLKSL
ncbi:FtsX-like permease family protein [Thermodesulfobacterium sp. TA1]|uniref:ABC transporter permease n=1 Tax=Thermodesulfobacterium sp. TA1 TaxID=2234087 RepID=UPI0012327A5A|nr:ABC transporter permease [Thermodesulfobacterium sp. TA1]QER42040.1 FtsX-like permease family protein [Thermodesulfobacterium sp. TA1]